MLRRRRNSLIVAALVALVTLSGCRASGEIDVEENDGSAGVGLDVGR